MKKKLKFKSSIGKMYYVWIGKNGHISIDKKSAWILDISKFRGDYETIFYIYDTLRNRKGNISSIKSIVTGNACNILKLDKRERTRLRRMRIMKMKENLIESEKGSLTILIYRDRVRFVYEVIKSVIPKLNLIGRLVLKTFISLLGSLMESSVYTAFVSREYEYGKGITIKLNIVPDKNFNVEEFSKYDKLNYEFNVSRLWYHKHYLGKLFIVINNSKHVILREERIGNKEYYYYIRNGRGYSLKVDRIVVTDKNRDKINFVYNNTRLTSRMWRNIGKS